MVAEAIAEGFILIGWNNAVWFAAFDVEEDTAVIATISPNRCFRPIKPLLSQKEERCPSGGSSYRVRYPFSTQPFINTNATVHLLYTMI